MPVDGRSSSRCKAAVGSALRRPIVGAVARRILRERIPNRGVRIRSDRPRLDDATVAALVSGTYESHEVRLVRRFLAGSDLVVELGGSIGVIGAHVLDVMASDGRFVVAEADPVLVADLPERLEPHRRPDQQIEVIAAAVVGRLPSTGVVRFNSTVSDGDHLTGRVGGSLDSGPGEMVPAITLGDICSRPTFAVGGFDLVCDIEGAEHDLLRDDAAALERCRTIVVELHGTDADMRETFDRIRRLGFEPVERLGAVHAL
ncbi:MAG: hypothetical protein RLZZ01_2738, partial [Actinomycetota bacterium]